MLTIYYSVKKQVNSLILFLKFKHVNMCPRNLYVWLSLGVEIFTNIFYSLRLWHFLIFYDKNIQRHTTFAIRKITEKKEISDFTNRKLFMLSQGNLLNYHLRILEVDIPSTTQILTLIALSANGGYWQSATEHKITS